MKSRKMTTFILIIMIIASIFVFIPLLIMIFDSLKSGSELASNSWGFPQTIAYSNYSDLLYFNSGVIVRSYFNSLLVSITHTILVLIVSSLAAFAFSKYEFRGKNSFFILLIITMMIPSEITMPGIYLMFSRVGLLNSYSVQIFPGIASVFCLFMLRQYMSTIPDAMIEAARIDGASHMKIYWKVMIPMSAPALGAMAILTFLGKWNDYLWPRIMLTKTEVLPIMVVLPTLSVSNSMWSIPWEIVLAGCTIVTLPVIIVFLIFQDQFMAGVTMGSVKE